MKHRSAIEGTQSELVRVHGMRQARYRGLAKTKLEDYFTVAACNVKRWIRREVWKRQQAASALAPQPGAEASSQILRARAAPWAAVGWLFCLDNQESLGPRFLRVSEEVSPIILYWRRSCKVDVLAHKCC